MADCCQQATDLYVEAVGKVSFRYVTTPYVNENMLTQQDYEVQGHVSQKEKARLNETFVGVSFGTSGFGLCNQFLGNSSDSLVKKFG